MLFAANLIQFSLSPVVINLVLMFLFAASCNPAFGIPNSIVAEIAKENAELDQQRFFSFLVGNCFLV